MTLVDPRQFYSGFNVSYEEKNLELFVEQPNETVKMLDLWDKAFSGFSSVNVCLSGGVDSQFTLSILNQLSKKIHVYIFSLLWDDNIINSSDVLHAIRYCNRYNHTYTNIEIDYKNFLHTGQHLKICRQYKCLSPQVAAHLKMLDYIEDTQVPVFLGGDIPFFQYDFEKKEASMLGVSSSPFHTNVFLNYSLNNNRVVVKDLFRLNPETHYMAFKQILETTKKHKIVLPAKSVMLGSTQPFRILFYSDIGADLIPPLLKNTGFESLKKHLAQQSGIYNQYDLMYRRPLENTLKHESWFNSGDFKIKVKKPYLSDLKSEFELFCQSTPDLKRFENYDFIL